MLLVLELATGGTVRAAAAVLEPAPMASLADAFANRPLPALTPAQRYRLDTFGYCVVQNTLTPAETAALLAELKGLRDELLEENDGAFPPTEEFGRVRVRNAYLGGSENQHSVVNLVAAGGRITGYAAHPRMVAMAEELIG